MRLSKHFSLAEAGHSQTAVRLGIDNTPPESVIAALGYVSCHILEPVRRFYGYPLRPSSWYRCAKLNNLLRSTVLSQHLLGQAVDLDLPKLDNKELYDFISKELNYDQLILEYYQPGNPHSGWVHASYVDPARNRRQNFIIA